MKITFTAVQIEDVEDERRNADRVMIAMRENLVQPGSSSQSSSFTSEDTGFASSSIPFASSSGPFASSSVSRRLHLNPSVLIHMCCCSELRFMIYDGELSAKSCVLYGIVC